MVNIPKGSEIVDKVLQNTDKIGLALSFVTTLGGVQATGHHIARIIVAPRPPNFEHIMNRLADSLWIQAPLIIGGLLVESLDIPSVNKYARAMMKFGVGSIMGTALGAAVESSHNPQPGQGSLSSYAPKSESFVWKQKHGPGAITTTGRKISVTANQPTTGPSM